MMRWLKSLFAWRDVRSTGVWLYRENAITGQRAAVQIARGVYQPLDFDWLNGWDLPLRPHPLVNGAPAWRRREAITDCTAYFR